MGHAQTQQEIDLAEEYLQQGAYEKAINFYETFYKNSPRTKSYYKGYIECLIKTNNLKEAEKVIKKQVRENPQEVTYQIDLGEFYKSQGETKKVKTIFDDILKNTIPYYDKIEEQAAAFTLIGEIDYAIETYQKGKKLIGNVADLNFSLAELYGLKKNYSAMTSELLDVIKNDDLQLEALKSALMTMMDDNPDSEMNITFKEAILKEIQKNTDNLSFQELFIWLMLQQKNYDAAFAQTKALDKKGGYDGSRVLLLSNICLENNQFETAIQCIEYVIGLGKDKHNYMNAKKQLLDVLNTKLKIDQFWTQSQLLDLESKYIEVIYELGNEYTTLPLKIDLANLQAFYLNNATEAKKNLEEILVKKVGKIEDLTRAKMKLADVLILLGDLWEPALLYGQIEKDFKQDVIGQEAKFRNAKLSFYRCEFEWAQLQMDALKSSTSKLISNDAIALSMLISINSGLDTTFDAISIYARGDLYYYQGLFDQSILCFDTLEQVYKGHSLIDEAKFKRAEIALKKGDDKKALEYLNDIATNYSFDILADDALYKQAEIYQFKLNDVENAMKCYEKIILEHKDSIYIVEARKRFRNLRGDKVN